MNDNIAYTFHKHKHIIDKFIQRPKKKEKKQAEKVFVTYVTDKAEEARYFCTKK
jgi:hypothetical protein